MATPSERMYLVWKKWSLWKTLLISSTKKGLMKSTATFMISSTNSVDSHLFSLSLFNPDHLYLCFYMYKLINWFVCLTFLFSFSFVYRIIRILTSPSSDIFLSPFVWSISWTNVLPLLVVGKVLYQCGDTLSYWVSIELSPQLMT